MIKSPAGHFLPMVTLCAFVIFIGNVTTVLASDGPTLSISSYTIETYDGRDQGNPYTGAWITLRNLKSDKSLLKRELAFEFGSEYENDDKVNLGVSSFRTFSPNAKALWSIRNHASLGDRFWLFFKGSPTPSDRRKVADFYQSLSTEDRKIFVSVCHVVSNTAFMSEVVQKLEHLGLGTTREFRTFWGKTIRKDQFQKLGEMCIGATGLDLRQNHALRIGSKLYVSDGTSYAEKSTDPTKTILTYNCVGWERKPDTERVQQALKDMGYYFGPINGRMSESCDALRKYAERSTSAPSIFTSEELDELYSKIRTKSASQQPAQLSFCGIGLLNNFSIAEKLIGESVAIQTGLKRLGLLSGVPDGIVGEKTCTAFRAYARSLQQDPLTEKQFELLVKAGRSSSQNTDLRLSDSTQNVEQYIKNPEKPDGSVDSKGPDESAGSEKRESDPQPSNEKATEELAILKEELKKSETLRKDQEAVLALTQLELTKTDADMDDVLSQSAISRSKISSLEQQLNDLNDEAARRKIKSETLNTQLNEANTATSLANQELLTERLRAETLGKEILSLKSQLVKLRSKSDELDKVTGTVNILREKLKSERSTSNRLDLENSKLKQKLTLLEGELENFRAAETRKTDWIDKLSPEWAARIADMPVQQRQFCNIASEFRQDLREARESRNQIRINMTFQERQQSLDALLPEGSFRDWIVRVISVGQMPDGAARFIAEMPCQSMIGSGVIGKGRDAKWIATIEHQSRMYRELAKVSAGDFIAVQGDLLEVEGFEQGHPESFYGVNQIGDNPHPEVSALGIEGELFIARINYLIMIRQ